MRDDRAGDFVVNLRFYGGVGEIGGNKVLLEDGDTRILVDFGMSFGKRGTYYGDFLGPRTANGLGDFLEMDLVPDLKGLYRADLLATVGRKAESPTIDREGDPGARRWQRGDSASAEGLHLSRHCQVRVQQADGAELPQTVVQRRGCVHRQVSLSEDPSCLQH